MKIRKATIKDLDRIMKVYEELVEHHATFDDCFWTTKELVRDWRSKWRTYARKRIQDKKKYTLVAEEKGLIVGHLFFEFKKRVPIFKQNEYLFLSDLAVAKDFRGKGIGTRLIKESLKIAKKKKVFAANLHCRAQNKRARKLYSKLGFNDTMVEMVKKM